MKEKTIFLFGFMVLIFGCKKEEPIDKKTVLYGNWEWQYTYLYNTCTGTMTKIDTATEQHTFQLKLWEDWKIGLYEDNVLISEEKIYYTYFKVPEQGIVEVHKKFEFSAYLDGDETKKISGDGSGLFARIGYAPFGLDSCVNTEAAFWKKY